MATTGVPRRRARGRTSAAAALVSLAVALTACSAGSSGSSSAPGAGGAAPGGANASGSGAASLPPLSPSANPTPLSTVTVNGSNPVLTLDNAKAGDITSLNVTYLSQGMLFHVAPDGSTVPDLVKKHTLSSDGLTLTLDLRPGLKYSDNTPVTAGDVVAAYQHGKAGLWGPTVLASVKNMTATSDTTVKVNLAYPDPDILTELTGRAMAINPAKEVAGDPNYFNHPVSAGPYVVQNYSPGQQNVTLVENPNYWGGPMMAKKIIVAGVSDDATRTLQIQSGQIDIAWKVPYASKDTVAAVDNVTVAPIGGYLDLFIRGPGNPPFDKPLVRKAVSLALDRKAISTQVYQGLLPPRTSYLWSCGAVCQPGLLPNGGKQDVAQAKQLLKQAGVTGPVNVTIETTTTDNMADTAVVIKNQLKAIGINATIKQVDTTTGTNDEHAGNFQLLVGEGAQLALGAGLLTFFSSTSYNSQFTGIKDNTLNALANQAKQELNPAKRKALVTKLQIKANDVMPIVPLLEREQVNAFSKKLPAGFTDIPTNTQILNIQSVAEAKAGKYAGQ